MVYGFIGLGNMAGAIIRGMHGSGAFANDTVLGYNRSENKTLKLKEETGLVPCSSESETAMRSDVVILAVKPQMLPAVLPEIVPEMNKDKLLISIAAGKSTKYYEDILGGEVPVVRIMPNINAKVGMSATAVCGGSFCREKDIETARKIFSAVGEVYELPEEQFPIFSAVAGASGAFIHLYIDALASAGVKNGLSRKFAEDLACQTVLGSAYLTKQSDEHPIKLMDTVCSPGGTTIEGVHVLKKLGFESAVHQAIDAIVEKDRKL